MLAKRIAQKLATKDLKDRIRSFLNKYAARMPKENWDDEYGFNGPDPYELLFWEPGTFPNSRWSSGCYKPYTSKEGEEEHHDILSRIKLINDQI